MADNLLKMRELVDQLNKASKAYYVDGTEIMSNFEYDALYDELLKLEEETGTVLSGSPTQQVGYEVLSELPKEEHPSRMLSLNKTKDREELATWLGNQEGLLSWKLDGLTVVLTYQGGELSKAVTRGNGSVGEVITANARTFVNLPLKIAYDGNLVIRGEAVISYKDFEEINDAIPELDAKYKNPRNLCSGSVRQLNSAVTRERRVRFYAFSLVSADATPERDGAGAAQISMFDSSANATLKNGDTNAAQISMFDGSANATSKRGGANAMQISMFDGNVNATSKRGGANAMQASTFDSEANDIKISEANSSENIDIHMVATSRRAGMEWLRSLGFDVVDYRMVTGATVVDAVDKFETEVAGNPIPSDGLVLTLDDIEYSRSLGETAKFPRDSIAFKWRDQIAETTLREIEWSASRTGLINPVAIFDPVELEGTTVTRASLHNISIMEELELGIGDTVEVYKANMIIPQIADNLTRSAHIEIPGVCPVCGQETRIHDENGVRTLFCENPGCTAKKIKSFTLFVSRDAMDVEGLSEMTIEKFIARGMIHEPADIFKLRDHRDEIVAMEGFGEKSFDNLMEATEKARHATPDRLLYALGVPGIGTANAKVIAKHCKNKWTAIQNLRYDELTSIDGVGDVLADGFRKFFDDEENVRKVSDLLEVLDLDENYEDNSGAEFLTGHTFVITGSLNHFANRDALVEVLEKAGAKVAGSVSSKTSYLINNDITSNSGKNKKAKDLGIPIITEDEVLEMLNQN